MKGVAELLLGTETEVLKGPALEPLPGEALEPGQMPGVKEVLKGLWGATIGVVAMVIPPARGPWTVHTRPEAERNLSAEVEPPYMEEAAEPMVEVMPEATAEHRALVRPKLGP